MNILSRNFVAMDSSCYFAGEKKIVGKFGIDSLSHTHI